MDAKPFIALPTTKGVELIPVKNIVSVCSDDKISCFTLEGGEKRNHNIPIGKVEKLLSHAFFARCHQRCIVNIYKIKEVFKGSTGFMLSDNTEFSISRTYKDSFRNSLELFCIKM